MTAGIYIGTSVLNVGFGEDNATDDLLCNAQILVEAAQGLTAFVGTVVDGIGYEDEGRTRATADGQSAARLDVATLMTLHGLQVTNGITTLLSLASASIDAAREQARPAPRARRGAK